MKGTVHACFILATFLSVVIITKPSFAADGQIKISQNSLTTFPIVINKAGSYVLTSHLVADDPSTNVIEITANDVRLDLNGFTIKAPGNSSGCGIFAWNQYNITVRNGRIWGFHTGIGINSSPSDPSYKSAGHRIAGLQVANNTFGIIISAGIITNCSANNNASTGIAAWNTLISCCIANNNGLDGFQVEDSIISYCTAHYNQQDGIHDIGKSRIEGNNIRNNSRHGLGLASDGASYVIKNAASDNGDGNFYMASGNYSPTTGDNANYGF